MEIKRMLRISTTTKRRIVVSSWTAGEPIICPRCGTEMLEVKQAAIYFGIEQREIFQMIENDRAHFVECEGRSVFVCVAPLIER